MKMMTVRDAQSGELTAIWDGRATMRTLADALAKLQDLGALPNDGHAEIKTMSIPLPTGESSAVVTVAGPAGSGWQIAMPTSSHFEASDTLGERQRYEICKLAGAKADARGNVDLPDGSYVHNVKLEPTNMNFDLTPVEREILRLTISALHGDHCYCHLDEQLLPGVRVLDFAALRTLKVPSFKVIKADLDNFPASRRTIQIALAKSGLRPPRSRRRAG